MIGEARADAAACRGAALSDWLADHGGPPCPEHGRAAMREGPVQRVGGAPGWTCEAALNDPDCPTCEGELCGYTITEDGLREQLADAAERREED